MKDALHESYDLEPFFSAKKPFSLYPRLCLYEFVFTPMTLSQLYCSPYRKQSMHNRFIFTVGLLALLRITVTASGPDDRTPTDPRLVNIPLNPEARPIPIDDLYYTRSVSNPAWSPDGKELAFTTDLTGRLNIWKMPVAGGWPVQMVQSDERQMGAIWSRDGKWIVYQQDRGGGEYWDLYAVPSAGGAAVNLTQTDDISEEIGDFSQDGSTLAITYKPRKAPNNNLALLDWKTRQVRQLTDERQPDRNWSFIAWSRDGQSLYGNRGNIGYTDSDVYRIDVGTGKTENLTPHQGEVLYMGNSVSSDGQTLLISSNEKGGYQNVALLTTKTRKLTWVSDTMWEASPGTFSPNGKTFTYLINGDGRTDVFMAKYGSSKSKRLPFPEGITFPIGRPTAFSPDGTRLLVSHQGSQRASDLWVLESGVPRPRQLTFSSVASVNPALIPPSQLVHYRSFDGKLISAYLWVPFNLKRDGSHPGIVLPHGGPTGQMLDYFNLDAVVLASRGYVVIAPNVRGSTGYGMEFQKTNYKDLGGGDLQDELHAADFLIATGLVTPKKIGITGGSYGGFMTLMAIGKAPDRWAAAVEQYGIINWFSMWEHSDALLQQYQKSLLGDPTQDREVYENSSPLKYLSKARAPLLVLHGENDIRVPKEEADQVVEVLRKAGTVVEAHYYPQEGHGFAKRENQIDAIRRTIDWFNIHLRGEPTAPPNAAPPRR
jgi:dipeptidyl aminopeptidase/acylaminoacyl peptidase